MNPEVSVIIPTWNTGSFIRETLDSVLNQTFQDWEVLVVDNGSEDNTGEVVQSLGDPRIRWIPLGKNIGAGPGRQKGLELAKGRWIQYLDGDDVLGPRKIELQVNQLRNHPESIAFGNVCFFWDRNNPMDSKPEPNEHFYFSTDKPLDFLLNLYGLNGRAGMVPIHSWLSPASLLAKAGPWNPEISVDDDGEYFCRAVLQAQSLIFEPRSEVYYRKFRNRKSLSMESSLRGMESMFQAWECKYQACTQYAPQDNRSTAVFAKQYMELADVSWPAFPAMTHRALKRVQELGGTTHIPLIGNPILNKLKYIFGWKAMKWISWQKNRLTTSSKRT